MLFKLIAFNQGKLSPAEEPLTVSQFCDRLLNQLKISAEKKRLTAVLEGWLIDNRYLIKDIDSGKLRPTALSDSIGIIELDKISRRGTEYKSLVIAPEGQSFIIERVKDIFNVRS